MSLPQKVRDHVEEIAGAAGRLVVQRMPQFGRHLPQGHRQGRLKERLAALRHGASAPS